MILRFSKKQVLSAALVILALLGASFLGVYIRSSTLSSPTVLDYDPWWFYRHAKEIVENDYKIPDWDTLSYYPPGRPYSLQQGWPYTIALMYKFASAFADVELMQIAKWSPLIMVALIPVPAFLLGRLISNNLGGLIAALLSVLAPTFIGVSMGGYSDSDVVTVFYMFLSVLTIVTAIKYAKNKFLAIPLYALSAVSVLLFTFNWSAGWLPLILFMAFIPAFVVFRIIEEIIHQRKLKINVKAFLPDFKSIVVPLLIIFVVTNIAGYLIGYRTMFHSLLGGLAFTGLGGERLIVNISVAELQTIDIFTKSGFLAVAQRVGMLPTIMTLIGLPLLVIYKLYRKEKINFIEIFLFMWALVSFYLIIKGVRFSLLFSVSASLSAGYVIGNLYNYLRHRNTLIFATVFAGVGVLTFVAISNGIQIGIASGGLSVSNNWYSALDWLKENADEDALVATWWDPGHIITGYTGLKAHADGAHCGYPSCSPYDHNTRIRDMGLLMSTGNETESIEIIKKYVHISPEECEKNKILHGDKFSESNCKDVTEVYVLATSDLIGKYYWMSCFGHFDMKLWGNTGGKQWKCDGRNYFQIPFSNTDKQGLPVYSAGGLTITLLQNGTDVLAVINSPSQGIRNTLVKDVVYYQNGVESRSSTDNDKAMDGMIWIDPSFSLVLFMDPQIRDSVFTRMFFFSGKDLNNFQMVYQNPEVKIFKAKLE